MAGDFANLGASFMTPVLQNQQYAQSQQMAPAELAQKAAAARYTGAMADRLQMETEGEKRVAAALAAQRAGQGSGEIGNAPSSISDLLHTYSNIYAAAGLPTKAAEFAEKASQASAHEATARAGLMRAKLQDFQLQKGQIEQVTKLLNGVHSAEDWKAANAAFGQQFGQRSPFADTEYDPELVKLLQAQSLSAYQQQVLDLKKTAVAIARADKESAMASRAVRDNIAAERLRVSQQREARLTKSGGKDTGAPGKVELEAARNLIGDTLDGDAKDSAAFSIASEAKVLRRKNPGLSADDAMRQALLTAQQSGNFVPGEKSRIPFFGKDSPAKFVTPQDLPKSGKQADLVVGNHYRGPDGKVYEWTKAKQWKAVGPSVGAYGSGAADAEGDDDDE